MTDKATETTGFQLAFPLTDYWEDLGVKRENASVDRSCDQHYAAAFDVLARPRPTGEPPVPRGLIITREQIAELLKPLELHSDAELIDRLLEIAARHLRPRHRVYFRSEFKTAAKQVRRLAELTGEVDQLLDEMAGETLNAVRHAHALIVAQYGSERRLDIGGLHTLAASTALAAGLLAEQMRRERKRPPHELRQLTLRNLTSLIEGATGKRIETSWSKKGVRSYRFKGDEGAFVRDFMRLIEPKASERSLVVLFRQIRDPDAVTFVSQ